MTIYYRRCDLHGICGESLKCHIFLRRMSPSVPPVSMFVCAVANEELVEEVWDSPQSPLPINNRTLAITDGNTDVITELSCVRNHICMSTYACIIARIFLCVFLQCHICNVQTVM